MTGQGKSAIDTLLAESFKELAKKHPIEKITIKEITDLAGVIRPAECTDHIPEREYGSGDRSRSG